VRDMFVAMGVVEEVVQVMGVCRGEDKQSDRTHCLHRVNHMEGRLRRPNLLHQVTISIFNTTSDVRCLLTSTFCRDFYQVYLKYLKIVNLDISKIFKNFFADDLVYVRGYVIIIL